MGCTISNSLNGEETYKRNGLILGTPEKRLISNAVSSSSGTKLMSLNEEARTKPPSEEEGTFKLPEGEFIDGCLGITNKNEIDFIMDLVSPGDYFVDKDFPPSNQSLYIVQDADDDDDIQWKRPHELVNNPEVFVGGVNRKDVIQGVLSDCWFLSSCAAVAKKQSLIERVIPKNQVLKGKGYKGLIICRFWRFGDWVTVCIDDSLPTKNDGLIYARSEDPNEFWIALLEKAYAKLHGSYQAMEGGQSMDAMVDLTGGIAERFDLQSPTNIKSLFNHIRRASKNGAFITTSRKGDWKGTFKADENGLVGGHAYTVSGVAKVNHAKKGIVSLIRMRNPWGNEAEWNGKWSDGDEMWDHVCIDMKRRLLKDNSSDGEFWMSFNEFFKEFEEISICAIGPDFDNDGVVDKGTKVLAIKGEWEIGKNAGGSRNDFRKFATNPQYLMTIKDAKDQGEEDDMMMEVNDEKDESLGKNHVLIGLLQEHRQSTRDERVRMNQIAICVYKSPDPSRRMHLSELQRTCDIGNSGVYINYREVICRVELPPGNYVLIPATFQPNTQGSYMVRVYSPSRFTLKSLD